MTTEKEKTQNPQAANVEALTSGITEVITAALSVGAAMARTAAQATAMGKPVPPGAAGEGPIADIIHYSVEAASNVARLVIRGIPSTIRPATTPTPSGSPAATATYPSVHAGATLRIPLSIENPTEAEMSQLTFVCGDLTYEGRAGGTPLTAAALSLEPATLTIAPRDFEKLTVFIATTEATATGNYHAKITVEGGSFESALRFEVLPAQA
jgi:hypothetical protein